MVRGSAGIILVSHVATVARQAYLDTPAGASRKGCLHSSAHQVQSGSSWLDTCWVLRSWGHSSCFPVTTGQIQVLPGLGRVRRCCRVGHSCMRRVIGLLLSSSQDGLAQRCSGNPNGSTPWWTRVRNFCSQLRFELDSVFQELDTPPSRCCGRCCCAMSGVSLITADIDQAFGACSSSAVLPARRRISQTYESRFSSNSILVPRGRRELCKPGSSQSFGRGWLSFTIPVLARALFSFTWSTGSLHMNAGETCGHPVTPEISSNVYTTLK